MTDEPEISRMSIHPLRRPGRLLTRSIGLVWAVGLTLQACGPKIHQFSVEPRRACPDDTLHIGFSVTGRPRLEVTATPAAEPETLTYTLIVDRHGKSVLARQDVVRFAARQEWPLVFAASPLGADSILTSDTLRVDDWNSTARLFAVSSSSRRALRVEHGGRVAILAADSTASEAFAGLTLAGPWRVAAALEPGEVLGDPAHAPPGRLRLRVTIACREGQ